MLVGLVSCGDANNANLKWTDAEREMCRKAYLSVGHMMEIEEQDRTQFVDCLCEKLEIEFSAFEKIYWQFLVNGGPGPGDAFLMNLQPKDLGPSNITS